MKILNKLQRRAAIWILEAFKTLPAEGIEAIASLIPIRFHLQKSQADPKSALSSYWCYDSRLKVSSQETTLVLSNTRELDGVLSTK